MYKCLVIIFTLSLMTGCYMRNLAPNPKVHAQYLDVFTESVIRMRDISDPRRLDLKEGQRIGERAFSGVRFSVLLAYFENKGGACHSPEHEENKYVCTVTKLVSMSTGRFDSIATEPCSNIVYLTYEFSYPGTVSGHSMWTSMRFYAETESRADCAAFYK